MKKIFTQLDRRNTGFGNWLYYVNRRVVDTSNHIMPLNESNQLFYAWREWCWDNWGASKELQYWLDDQSQLLYVNDKLYSQNTRWCWQHDQYNTRIYLKTDRELSEFLMRWH